MQMQKIEGSSQIKAAGYDAASRTLAIEFNSGGTWHYADVPPQTYEQFRAAKSAGSFLHSVIKPNHKATKV